MTDIIDDANERAAKWLNAQIEEHQWQMGHAVSAFEVGRCRNCDDKLDDGRNYCDSECAADFEARQKSERRNRKTRVV